MQKSDTTRTAPRRTRATAECCTDLRCESGLRNNYFEGKRLTPDTFRIEQRYLNERRRLLNRAVHGWGVVYGYAMDEAVVKDGSRHQTPGRVTVGGGLALDQCGRELLETGRRLTIEDLIVVDRKNRQTTIGDLVKEHQEASWKASRQQQKKPRPPICGLISAHYAEQSTDGVTLTDACRCERHEWDHVCETVRYTLRLIDCDRCCRDCECELCCSCGHGACCDHKDQREPHDPSTPTDQRPPYDQRTPLAQPVAQKTDHVDTSRRTSCEELPFKRGGCRCLCDHLTHLHPGRECDGVFCEIDEACARVRVDVQHGVPLACVQLELDDCDDWIIGEVVDACGPRRLVKRNDLLFDLIRGCDLTRIHQIGWAGWHRKTDPIPFDDFTAAFGARHYDQLEYVTKDFWVRFSKPVREDTLAADCFVMTIMSVEREGKWRQAQRVPIVRVEPISADPGDPAGHVRGATIVVEGGWAEDALWGRGSVFLGETWVELEVRGDFILDCNGQPVDAEAVGRLAAPTGNGSPGGTFLSTFQVAPREPHSRQTAPSTADRAKGSSS
jgi:hypothetical protein